MGDPAAPGLHSLIHPTDHTHTHTLCFLEKGRRRWRAGGREGRGQEVWRSLQTDASFNSASMTFLSCIPLVFSVVSSPQIPNETLDYKEISEPPFSSSSIFFVSTFLLFSSFSVFHLLCLSSLSAALCSFLHVFPPAAFLHQSLCLSISYLPPFCLS